jgi:hypothetical protein
MGSDLAAYAPDVSALPRYASASSIDMGGRAYAPIGGTTIIPVTPPVVSNILPANGTPIYATTPLQFDITDTDVFTAVIVMVSFADGTYEVVYDSSVFATGYASSTFSEITDGFRFVLRRRGGWPSSPTLKVIGVDAAGAENPQ